MLESLPSTIINCTCIQDKKSSTGAKKNGGGKAAEGSKKPGGGSKKPGGGSKSNKKDAAVWVGSALVGSPAPSKTFVSYLLHCLLPQNRWELQQDRSLWERSKGEDGVLTSKKEKAYYVAKTAQCSARPPATSSIATP